MERLDARSLSAVLAFALAAALAALPSPPAAAKCAEGWLSVLPAPGTALPTNGRIVLEGYRQQAALVREIAARKPALAPDQPRRAVIPLAVALVQEGEFDVVQAVLVPTRPLLPGARYTLRLHGSVPGEPARWQPTVLADGPPVAATWPIATVEDTAAPTWGAPATVSGACHQLHGCGPSVDVAVAAPAKDDGAALLVRAEVRVAMYEATAWRSWLLPLVA